MGIFSRRESVVEMPMPDLDRVSLPDSKYIHKHFADVRQLVDVLPYRRDKPELMAAGAQLARGLIEGFPDLLTGSADAGIVPSMGRTGPRSFRH